MMVGAAGTTSYGYAAGGQLWTEDGPWASDTVTNIYNNRLRTSLSLAQPTGSWTNAFNYDGAKRLTNITSQAGAFNYYLGAAAAASPLAQKIALPNTSYITNTYDSVARLTGTWLKNSSGTILDSATYGYNTANQRTTFTNAAGTYLGYTYDPIGQLKVADSSVNSEDRGYQYDTAWNLNYRTNNGVLSTFTVDPKNQLTNATPVGAQTYDTNGNVTYSAGNFNGYAYDDENQLIDWYSYNGGKNGNGAPTAAGDLRTELVYDGRGRLRKRVEYTAVGLKPWTWSVSSETRYVYDGMRVVQERDGNNTPLVSYTRGTDLSGSLEGAGGIGGLLGRSHAYQTGNGNFTNHNFYHADGNGNVTYMLNTSQSKVAEYRYDPFGNTISSSGTLASVNVYRFSSKEIHLNSGMYYYGHRFYDPNLQRWPNRDPLEDGASLVYAVNHFDPEEDLGLSSFHVETLEGPNLYGFVANDPIGFWDGFGTSKGGKQNISCEGFTKKSCPADVAKALEEAKKLNQLKRARALQGLLKVIKRGGTMLFFWIDYYLILLNNALDDCGGGQPPMAYNNPPDNNMTSDGISTEDWEVVQDFAAKIANAACGDDEATSHVVTEKLLRYLECLEGKYGKLPSILATRADYATDLTQRLQLLEQAYELARQSGDKENLTLTASSLAQLFVEEAADVSLAQKWLALLADALGDKWDDLEHQEFQKLTAQVESLKQRGKPSSLA